MSRPTKRQRLGEPSIVDVVVKKQALDRLRREVDRELSRATPYLAVLTSATWEETAEQLTRGRRYCKEWSALVGDLQGELAQDLRTPVSQAHQFLSTGEELSSDMARVGSKLQEATKDLRLQRADQDDEDPGARVEETVNAFEDLYAWRQRSDVDDAFRDLEESMQGNVLGNVDVAISLQERIGNAYLLVSRTLVEGHGFDGAALRTLRTAIHQRYGDLRTQLRDVDQVVSSGAAVSAYLEHRASSDVLVSFLPSRKCYVCRDDFHLGLLACECGAYLCHDCVAPVIEHFCAPASAGERASGNGEVRCAVCKIGTYTLGRLKKHLDCTAFDVLIAARDDAKASLVAAATLAEERARAVVVPDSRVAIEADFAVAVARELNTLRCPHCQQAGGTHIQFSFCGMLWVRWEGGGKSAKSVNSVWGSGEGATGCCLGRLCGGHPGGPPGGTLQTRQTRQSLQGALG